MLLADNWSDFELQYAGCGEKYERWGDVYLQRPDPQAIWEKGPLSTSENVNFQENSNTSGWPTPHALYHRAETGGGYWEKKKNYLPKWEISYPSKGGELKFWIEPTGFKHTGLFPEQAVNWDFCSDLIRERKQYDKPVRVLNLFAYTGGATLACAAAGADEVVHVDASKGMITRAKENVSLSKLEDKYIRFIAEDCGRFVDREIRRGRKYQGIIMDPPAYGRGPAGELWKLEEALYPLVQKCEHLLADDGLFFLINSYTTGLSPIVLDSILRLAVCQKRNGQTHAAELGFRASKMNIILPCGAVGRWTQ